MKKKGSRLNTGNLQAIAQHRSSIGKREEKSQKAELSSGISLSPNFQLSNSLASNFLVALLITSSFVGVVNYAQRSQEISKSPLKYDNEGGFNQESFNDLLGTKMGNDISDQERTVIYNAAKQMPLQDRKMFALCLLKMSELDQNSSIFVHPSALRDEMGAFEVATNSKLSSHPNLKMFINLDKKTEATKLGIVIGHESIHCVQFATNEQVDPVLELTKTRFKKGSEDQKHKAAILHNINSLGNSEETKRCEQFFYEMKDYVRRIIAQNKFSSTTTFDQRQYLINLGKAIYENLEDVSYIGMDQAMAAYRKNFRDKFLVDLDNEIKTRGTLIHNAYSTVGIAFVDLFDKKMAKWEQMYQGVFCAEAIAHFGDIPEEIRKAFHPKMNEFVLASKETIFSKCLDGLGIAYKKMFDSIFPAQLVAAEEVRPDAEIKSASAQKLSGKQDIRKL